MLSLLAITFPSFANNNSWLGTALDTSLTCNDLVQISLDENCEAVIIADMIVEGHIGDPSDFEVEVLDPTGLPLDMPVNGASIGDTLYIIAIHLPTELSCWGKAVVEDKWAPSLSCSDHQLTCFENPASLTVPSASDNCDPGTQVIKLSENIDNDNPCSEVIITQTFVAIDASDNESDICQQIITITPPVLPSFPNDTIWSCTHYNSFPNIVDAKKVTSSLFSTGSGIPDVAEGNYCPFNIVHSDFIFDSDCGETFTIVRTWTVINWCTNEIITVDIDGKDNVQLIKVEDQEPPIVERAPFTINANIGSAINEDCGSTDLLLPPTLIDDCHNVTLRILTGIGEAIYLNGDAKNGGFIPLPGLPIGNHQIIYEARDECNNIDTIQVTVTVADQTAPVAICDELTNVSLGIDGTTAVPAAVLDDGSYDNCCLDSFLVRRMNHLCNDLDTIFQDSVILCCEDVGDSVQVIFRAVDCAGNVNDCMVLIEVEEKLPPKLISCPQAQIIDCQFYQNFLELPLHEGQDSVLEQFGLPEFEDNCQLIYLENSFEINLNQCLAGNIIRNWRVTDPGGNLEISCTQTIEVNHYSDWLVEFPEDVHVDCGEQIPPISEPTIFYENCELIAVSYEDEIFTVVPDVCFKIVRTWTAINWCLIEGDVENVLVESSEAELGFDLNYDQILHPRLFKDGLNTGNFSQQSFQFGSQPDGIVVYQQNISVTDETAPVVNCQPLIEICVEDTSCVAIFTLPTPDVQDCGIELSYSASGDLGTGLGPFTDVPLGIYDMIYEVDDNCGNRGICATQVEVRDCKKPTPFCKDGLIVEMEADSILVVNAEVFNDGSFDNCPGELVFSFSIDPNDSTMIFDCSTLGFFEVNVWLTDESGNQDFCITDITIQDNDGVCAGLPLISGTVESSAGVPIPNVTISLNSGSDQTLTDSLGFYQIEASLGDDISLAASKTGAPLNGVTTYDIVLIRKHILGLQLLDNPYDIIAADVNNTNTVTTSDLVTIRKLILQINSEFPSNESWRFIDQHFDFPNTLNPFATLFPEIMNFNNIIEDEKNVNMVGVKLGDVNRSVQID
ncbi:MAG: hypothetical protein AAFZ15_17460 [Bacteroidota bacterium]